MVVRPNRSCGNCTACCKTHAVGEIEKPAGKWCPHCIIGKKCSIYENRPWGCKVFKCEWLKGFGRESHRPDRTRIVLNFYAGGRLSKILQIWKVGKSKLGDGIARKIALFILTCDIPVAIIDASGKKELILCVGMKISEEMKCLLRKEQISVVSIEEMLGP